MDNEFKSRYGRFPIFDTLIVLFSLFFLFVFFVWVLYYKYFLILFLINLFWVWRLVSPYFEKYYIQKDSIVCKKFQKCETLVIPPDAVFVVSYAAVENSVAYKKTCMVSIVDETPVTILQKLHENDRACEFIACRRRVKGLIYDSRYIESVFGAKVVYSFVYDDETQRIFNHLKRSVILPQSLESRIPIIQNGFDVILDEGR